MKNQNLQNTGGKLHAVEFGRGALDTAQKTLTTKAKMDKWDEIKLWNSCTWEQSINKVKGQPKRQDTMLKIIANSS